MSKHFRNSRACPHCGLTYGAFRTGFTFRDVYHMIFDRPHKRRNGVLGAWCELKRQLWDRHVETECSEGVPF